jgi:hypothetical protein
MAAGVNGLSDLLSSARDVRILFAPAPELVNRQIEYYRQQYQIPEEAIACGSDLTALGPRRLLGMFVGLRARHWQDIGRLVEAGEDYLLARDLFPNSFLLQRKARETRSWQYGDIASRPAAPSSGSLAARFPAGPNSALDQVFAALGGSESEEP